MIFEKSPVPGSVGGAVITQRVAAMAMLCIAEGRVAVVAWRIWVWVVLSDR